MPVALLDVNVMIALAWPNNLHHRHARRWFAVNHQNGWATCPLTQLSFLRLSMQPAVVDTVVSFASAFNALVSALQSPEHQFWPIDYPLTQLLPEIRTRLIGTHQVTDALLLDLAIRNSGKLATFDKRLKSLFPPESTPALSIELIES